MLSSTRPGPALCDWEQNRAVGHPLTAPAALNGTASIVGQFLAGDGGQMRVAVRCHHSEIWSALDSGKFDLTKAIHAVDKIDSAIYGTYYCGNTPFEVKIDVTPVPEPSTCFAGLCAVAVVGLSVFRSRK